MAYTKDYYHVLQLPAPGWSSKQQTTPAELRRAYKVALLAAHPDKTSAVAATAKTKTAYTVDDVKEAYTTLASEKTKTEYDNWFLHHYDSLATTNTRADTNTQPSSDFVLGLELLDLGDFEVWEPEDGDTSGNATSSEQTTWTRACRCGADKGFSILEEELEDAEERGENEVLVGCVGCSLWVRVVFDVEVG
jgi:diphthamide biosynthesis protein 4